MSTLSFIRNLKWSLAASILVTACAFAQSSVRTFVNPLLPTGPDPWIVTWNGSYFFTSTTETNITLWKTVDITDLKRAEKKVIWSPEPGKPWSAQVWAPELTHWGEHWYIYFAADAGSNDSHRIYVLESGTNDPMKDDWTFKGNVADPADHWAIDTDVFEVNGTHYMLWSGWKGEKNGEQDIFIARMLNPWMVDSARTLISAPFFPWEKIGDLPEGHIDVNEGPEALVHGGKVFVFFSASGCWTDSYQLGAVVAPTNADLLSTASWKKFDHSFLHQNPQAGVYATGHNGFFTSPDGKQDWIVYHANDKPGEGCGTTRSPRIQRFYWNSDGTPNFGPAVGAGIPLPAPQ